MAEPGWTLPVADERPVMQDFKDMFTHIGQFPGHKTGQTAC